MEELKSLRKKLDFTESMLSLKELELEFIYDTIGLFVAYDTDTGKKVLATTIYSPIIKDVDKINDVEKNK